jgi:Histidine kinase-, DNA gyrase B-, and HSP90-like ATPase
MSKVLISNSGIKKALKKIGVEEAIAEYIWNGFDAQATSVELAFQTQGPFGQLGTLTITDNGTGIPADLLKKKFTPFLESEKAFKKKAENIGLEGKNGYGRLTFYKFAEKAHWDTCFHDGQNAFGYSITIQAASLDDYKASKPQPMKRKPGTSVSFTFLSAEIHEEYFTQRIKPFLQNEFAWYLEVNRQRGLQLTLQGEKMARDPLMADHEHFAIEIEKDPTREETWYFQCTYVQWKNRLNDEYSRLYFLDHEGRFKYKTNTRLNKKGDNFYHSIVIKSDFFDHLAIYDEEEAEDARPALFSELAPRKVYRILTERLNNFLRKKRKPFLHRSADSLINNFEAESVMPPFGNNPWDRMRKAELETLVKGLYEAEPGLFSQLNTEQKKTFLGLLNLALDSDERDNLFTLLGSIVELDAQDRATLGSVLRTTRLTHVTHALKLVRDRLAAIATLKAIVFNHELRANERDHVQKVMEAHYWILGEQYGLVCAAEAKFETALRNYLEILREGEQRAAKPAGATARPAGTTARHPAGSAAGEPGEENPRIDHPDKLKEMDIFLVRQLWGTAMINNVVVELKSPTTVKLLTTKQLDQIKRYMNVILSVDAFNAQSNATWDFFLIGQDYDGSIANEKKNAEHHGEKDLVFKVANYRIYVKRWSEIFIDVELRLQWLNDKLKFERDKLTPHPRTAREAVAALM